MDNDKDKTPVATKVSSNQGTTMPVKDISSPHELTAFVRAITDFLAYLILDHGSKGGNSSGAAGLKV